MVLLILITFFLLSMFIDGLLKLHKQEQDGKLNQIREGIEGYLDQIFGYNTVTLFNTLVDAEGTLSYVVYQPKHEWFKSPEYHWYEVFETEKGFKHEKIKS